MDDATRFVYTYPMRAKSDSSACLLRFLAEARSDSGGLTEGPCPPGDAAPWPLTTQASYPTLHLVLHNLR